MRGLFIKLLLLLVIIFVVFSVPTNIKAENFESASDKVTVFPAKFELSSKPGEKIEQVLRITNEDDYPAIFGLSIEHMGVNPDTGEIVLGKYVNSYPNYLCNWIKFRVKGAEFAPKETREIKFIVDIPKDAEPGGKYASIVISMDRVTRQAGDFASTAKVISMIMLNVSGDIKENAISESFNAVHEENSSNISFVLGARNRGDSHIKPKGNIVITNFAGRKIDEISIDEVNILPSTIRRITTFWQNDHILFGRYTATLISFYGEKNDKSLTAATTFYSFNSWVLSLVLAFLSAIVLLIFIWKKRIGLVFSLYAKILQKIIIKFKKFVIIGVKDEGSENKP